MTGRTVYGTGVDSRALDNYFAKLVDLLFKILPMRECEEESLPVYLKSLLCELTGFSALFEAIEFDAGLLTILGILQFLIEEPECTVPVVRREVFQMISICNRLRSRYGTGRRQSHGYEAV